MKLARPVAAALVASALLLAPVRASAIVVEKVVAVVADRAILQSDLRRRARPFLQKIYATFPEGPQRTAEESKMFSELIDRIVDEQLESDAAVRASVTVSSEEVDNALNNIAAMGRVSVAKLFDDVRSNTGMTEQEYRQEIRRQVLEGKLVQRLVQDRIRVTEQDLERMYDRVLKQERAARQYNPAWIVIRVGESPTPEVEAERRAFTAGLAARARAGEDFAILAQQNSDDGSRARGGDLGIRAPLQSPAAMSGKAPILAPKLDQVAQELDVGQVSDPIRYKDAWVLLKLVSRQPSRYTTLEAARREMIQRVKAEQLENAKAKWLKDLRNRTHWEIRR